MRTDWVEVGLGTICDFIGGGTPSKSNPEYWAGEIQWASIKDLKGSFLIRTEDSISEEGLKNSASNLALEGDIILATRINPGRPIISKIRVAINQDLKIVKPLLEFSPRFLFYLFKEIEPKVLKLSSGTTVLGINLANLKSIAVPLPPLPEQRAIVARIEELFSELDHAVSSLKSAQAKLDIYRQAVLKKAFEGGFTKGENWEWKGITEIISNEKYSIKAGPFGSSLKKEFYTESGFKVYGQEQVISGDPFLGDYFIGKSKYNELKTCSVQPGDILISLVGTVGKVLILPENALPGIINPRLIKITLDDQVYNRRFFKYYFESSKVKSLYKMDASGTTMDVLNLGVIKRIPFPLPPTIQEQEQIVQEIESRLSVADKLAETIQTNLQKSEALRESILKKAFEGRLLSESEVEACRKEVDWEPAERLLERIKQEKSKSKKL